MTALAARPHPQMHVQSGIALACAACGAISHVTSESQVRDQLRGDSGTGRTQRHDGRRLCATCSRHAECTEHGHAMGE